MPKLHLIFGPSGSGKTTIGKELSSRGYTVIDTDREIATWISKETNEEIAAPPSYPLPVGFREKWVWAWSDQKMRALLELPEDTDIFLCGLSTNAPSYFHFFKTKFALLVSNIEIERRLLIRDPKRWTDDPNLLNTVLRRNSSFESRYSNSDVIFVNGELKTVDIVDEILSSVF